MNIRKTQSKQDPLIKKVNISVFTLLVLASLCILNAAVVFSIPVPSGVSGIVYELDGITQVPAGLNFTVENLNSGQMISGKTGLGSSGRYSVSLAGNLGDVISITVVNDWHYSSRNVSLQGVMRNVDLLLNMTPPPLPPGFVTNSTLAQAYEDIEYTTRIEATDINNDDLNYSLIDSPSFIFMNQTTGIVSFTPTQDNVGNYTLLISVTDGVYIVNQTFYLEIVSVNDPLMIVSSPLLSVTQGTQYLYDFTVADEENDTITYALVDGPFDAAFNTSSGVLSWTPSTSGVFAFTLFASDGHHSVNQSFNVTVLATPAVSSQTANSAASSSSGGGAGGGVIPPLFNQQSVAGEISLDTAASTLVFSEQELAYLRTLLQDERVVIYPTQETTIELLPSRPIETTPLDQHTYQYLSLSGEIQPSTIFFVVDNDWLAEYSLSTDDVLLQRYAQGTWSPLDTNLIDSQDTLSYFATSTPGFSYFAITSSQPIDQELFDIDSSVIRLPYIIKGIVYRWGRFAQYPANTPVLIENLNTSQQFTIYTGVPSSTGGYLASIPGTRGDAIRITVGDYSTQTVLGEDGTLSFDFVKRLFGSGFGSITGNAIFAPQDVTAATTGGIILFIVLLLAGVCIRFIYAKRS